MYLPPAHENGFIQLSEHSPVRNAVCTLSIGDKIVKTTSLQSSLNPVWNESLELKINMTSPLESFLVAEVWCSIYAILYYYHMYYYLQYVSIYACI
jgi:hypothetical protein